MPTISVTRLGWFLTVLCNIFLSQNSRNIYLGYFGNIDFWAKTDVATFWAIFKKSWAPFYSTIWSHCLQQKTLFSLSWHFKSKNDLISFSKKSFLIVIAVFIQHNRFWWTQTSRRAKWHKMLMPLTRTLVSFHERLKFGCFLKIK